MAKIPQILEKYFKDPIWQKKKNSASSAQLNEHIRKCVKLGEEKDVGYLTIASRKAPLPFPITEKNCLLAFSNSSWRNLKLEQKARTVFQLINSTMQENHSGAKTPHLDFILSQQLAQIDCKALFWPDALHGSNHIYLSPKILNSTDPMEVLSDIAHELQHCEDYHICDTNTIPYIEETYVGRIGYSTKGISNLPLEGTIKNLRTGKEEPITPELRSKFLAAKCRKSPLTPAIKYTKLSQCHTTKNILDLMEYLAYFYSPLENRAHHKGYETAKRAIEMHKKMGAPTKVDEESVARIGSETTNNENEIKLFEQISGVPMYHICDLFVRRKFMLNEPKYRKPSTEKIAEITTELQSIAEHVLSRVKNSDFVM